MLTSAQLDTIKRHRLVNSVEVVDAEEYFIVRTKPIVWKPCSEPVEYSVTVYKHYSVNINFVNPVSEDSSDKDYAQGRVCYYVLWNNSGYFCFEEAQVLIHQDKTREAYDLLVYLLLDQLENVQVADGHNPPMLAKEV